MWWQRKRYYTPAIYGGRCTVRINHFKSVDWNKTYNEIKDYLVFLDISGMYVSIMKNFEFPYDKSRYATKKELEHFNILIKEKNYDELLKILPEFYIFYVIANPMNTI